MNRRALITLTFASLGLAVGIQAFAAPPVSSTAARQKSPTKPLPQGTSLDGPEFRLKELKAVKPLTASTKMALLGGAGYLEPSITLSPRTPWHQSGAQLNFHRAHVVSTQRDVAYLFYRPRSNFWERGLELVFNRMPERRYIVDCRVTVGPNEKVEIDAIDESSQPIRLARAELTPANSHVSLVIPRSSYSYPRITVVTVTVEGNDSTKYWGTTGCELTPVR